MFVDMINYNSEFTKKIGLINRMNEALEFFLGYARVTFKKDYLRNLKKDMDKYENNNPFTIEKQLSCTLNMLLYTIKKTAPRDYIDNEKAYARYVGEKQHPDDYQKLVWDALNEKN